MQNPFSDFLCVWDNPESIDEGVDELMAMEAAPYVPFVTPALVGLFEYVIWKLAAGPLMTHEDKRKCQEFTDYWQDDENWKEFELQLKHILKVCADRNGCVQTGEAEDALEQVCVSVVC